jgi:hypothetical protein
MSDIPLFWDPNFAQYQNCTLEDIVISNGRRFRLNFQIAGDLFLVPGRLTFGGFHSIDWKPVNQIEFYELVNIMRTVYSMELDIKWKLPPQYFFPEVFLVQNEISDLKDFKEVVDFNQHIDVADWKTASMSKGNQKKLRQSVSVDMIMKTATADDIQKCYEILYRNRQAIGAGVTMSLDEIQDALRNFPRIYEMKYLELGGEVAAMCLTVDIAPTIRYVLYWADNLSLRNYSPVVLLCKKLVEQSRNDGIQVLDLGISSNQGMLNEGLHRFKQNLGAITTVKKTLSSI